MVAKKDWATYPKGRKPVDPQEKKRPINFKGAGSKPLIAPNGDGFEDEPEFNLIQEYKLPKTKFNEKTTTGKVVSGTPKKKK